MILLPCEKFDVISLRLRIPESLVSLVSLERGNDEDLPMARKRVIASMNPCFLCDCLSR